MLKLNFPLSILALQFILWVYEYTTGNIKKILATYGMSLILVVYCRRMAPFQFHHVKNVVLFIHTTTKLSFSLECCFRGLYCEAADEISGDVIADKAQQTHRSDASTLCSMSSSIKVESNNDRQQ